MRALPSAIAGPGARLSRRPEAGMARPRSGGEPSGPALEQGSGAGPVPPAWRRGSGDRAAARPDLRPDRAHAGPRLGEPAHGLDRPSPGADVLAGDLRAVLLVRLPGLRAAA